MQGSIENAGTLNLAGRMSVGGGPTPGFVNLHGAVLNISTSTETSEPVILGESAGIAVNYGVVNKIGPARSQVGGTTVGALTLNNYGSIHVQEGTLDLYASGAEEGTTFVESGATLILSGTRARTSSSQLAGGGSLRFEKKESSTPSNVFPAGSFTFPGDLSVTGGSVAFNGVVAPASVSFTGGTATFNDVLEYSGPLEIGDGATAAFAKPQTFPSLVLNGTLKGIGDVTISNSFTGHGALSGVGRLILLSSCASTFISADIDGRPVENWGTASLSGTVSIRNAAVFTNKPGASFTVVTAGRAFYRNFGNSASFVNQGTLIKAEPVSTVFDLDIKVTNTGTIQVLAGQLTINSFSGPTNAIEVSPGASLTLKGSYTINQPLAISAGGKLTLRGSWTNNSTISVDAGGLVFDGLWTNSGTLNVNNSTWEVGGAYSSLGVHAGTGNTFTYLGTFSGPLLVADSTTGDITLRGLTANGTLFKTSGGASFRTYSNSTVTLNGCSLDGLFSVEGCGLLQVSANLTFVNNAVLRVRNNPCNRTAIVFIGAPSQTLGGQGTVSIEDANVGMAIGIQNPPSVTIGPDLTIRFGAGQPASGNATIGIFGGRTLINRGRIESVAPGRTLVINNAGSLNNQGILDAAEGNISVETFAITNYSATTFTLTAGSWRATNGSLLLGARTIRTIGASTEIAIRGITSSILNISELSSNLGTLRIADRALAITPNGGTLLQSGLLELDAGSNLQINGALNCAPQAVLRVNLAGTDTGEFGSVSASGPISLAGALRGKFSEPYIPMSGDVFPSLLSAPQITGTFSSVCFDSNPQFLGVLPILDSASAPNTLSLLATPDSGLSPYITSQPADASASPNAIFTLTAVPGDATYQWHKGQTPLADGPTGYGSIISGASSSTLTITSARPADAGEYIAAISNSCASVLSNPVELRLCSGDLNSDGFVDDPDFSIFVVSYNILDCTDPSMPPNCPGDLNADAVVDDADFTLFVVAYDEFLCP